MPATLIAQLLTRETTDSGALTNQRKVEINGRYALSQRRAVGTYEDTVSAYFREESSEVKLLINPNALLSGE